MAKIAVILVLVGLTVMTSAYSLRPPLNQGMQAEQQDNQLAEMEFDHYCPRPCIDCAGQCCLPDSCIQMEREFCVARCLLDIP
jgi:hypothetical protein